MADRAPPRQIGEGQCTFNGATVALSGVAADACDTFSAAGATDGGVYAVTVAKDGATFAVYPDAVFVAGSPNTLALGTPALTVGTLTDGDSVAVYVAQAPLWMIGTLCAAPAVATPSNRRPGALVVLNTEGL